MSKSKRGLVEECVRRAVAEAVKDIAFDTPDAAAWLRNNLQRFKAEVAGKLLYDPYRWLELCDIFAWRKRKVDQ